MLHHTYVYTVYMHHKNVSVISLSLIRASEV